MTKKALREGLERILGVEEALILKEDEYRLACNIRKEAFGMLLFAVETGIITEAQYCSKVEYFNKLLETKK